MDKLNLLYEIYAAGVFVTFALLLIELKVKRIELSSKEQLFSGIWISMFWLVTMPIVVIPDWVKSASLWLRERS